MALKNWKKSKYTTGDSFAFVSSTGELIHGFIPRDKKYFLVRIGYTDDELLKSQKKFKYRSEAIKFAKDYMRKN